MVIPEVEQTQESKIRRRDVKEVWMDVRPLIFVA